MDPIFVAITWSLLVQSGWLLFGSRIEPVHLLWTCLWLKAYATEEIHSGQVHCDEKTFREKVWFITEGVARLDTLLVRMLLTELSIYYDKQVLHKT